MPLEEAVPLLAGIGYDGIEIAVQPGFDGEPSRMDAGRRKADGSSPITMRTIPRARTVC